MRACMCACVRVFKVQIFDNSSLLNSQSSLKQPTSLIESFFNRITLKLNVTKTLSAWFSYIRKTSC